MERTDKGFVDALWGWLGGTVYLVSTPQNSFARTAALCGRVEYLAHAGSTNADLVAAAGASPQDWPHLSVLLTHDQRAGRGRLDRSWRAPAGASLAVSVLVRVGDVPPAARGWLPLLAGAAMTRAVSRQIAATGRSAGLKWPNDVLVDGRKICGILAAVVAGDPDAVVIGSGINTRMTDAQLPVSTATSFAVLDAECDEDALLADYLSALDASLTSLAAAAGDAQASGCHALTESLCVTLGRDVTVSLPDGTALRGRALRIAADGRLVVAEIASGVEHEVSAGDVVHLR